MVGGRKKAGVGIGTVGFNGDRVPAGDEKFLEMGGGDGSLAM